MEALTGTLTHNPLERPPTKLEALPADIIGKIWEHLKSASIQMVVVAGGRTGRFALLLKEPKWQKWLLEKFLASPGRVLESTDSLIARANVNQVLVVGQRKGSKYRRRLNLLDPSTNERKELDCIDKIKLTDVCERIASLGNNNFVTVNVVDSVTEVSFLRFSEEATLDLSKKEASVFNKMQFELTLKGLFPQEVFVGDKKTGYFAVADSQCEEINIFNPSLEKIVWTLPKLTKGFPWCSKLTFYSSNNKNYLIGIFSERYPKCYLCSYGIEDQTVCATRHFDKSIYNMVSNDDYIFICFQDMNIECLNPITLETARTYDLKIRKKSQYAPFFGNDDVFCANDLSNKKMEVNHRFLMVSVQVGCTRKEKIFSSFIIDLLKDTREISRLPFNTICSALNPHYSAFSVFHSDKQNRYADKFLIWNNEDGRMVKLYNLFPDQSNFYQIDSIVFDNDSFLMVAAGEKIYRWVLKDCPPFMKRTGT